MILTDADYLALAQADEETIKRYVSQGFTVNTPLCLARTGGKPVRHTLLYLAAKQGSLARVKFLLAYGANADSGDPDVGDTPLHGCCEGNHVETARELLRAGANARAANGSGWTVLHEAAYWGVAEIAALLIERGADVNARNDRRETPLHAAAAGNGRAPQVVQALLKAGADPRMTDREGKTACQRAQEQAAAFPACREIVRLLGGRPPGFFQRLLGR